MNKVLNFLKAFVVISLFYCSFPLAAPPDLTEGLIISDDEIESYLTDILQRIFDAMGIPLKPQAYVLVSSDINAFATYGGQVVVYTGLIAKCDHAGELIAVLAHEAGHIAGGHLARMDAAVNQSMIPAIATTLIGGAASLATGNPAPLMAGVAGASQMFDRSIKTHTRGEEENADSAASNVLGSNTAWMVDMLKLIDRNTNTAVEKYTSTHPLTPDRIATAKEYAERNKHTPMKIKLPEDYVLKYDFLRKKTIAYTKKTQLAFQDFPASDTSAPNRYGRAIYLYRLGKTDESLKLLNQLITEYPNSPYFTELKAQIDFEQGRTKDAVDGYRKAVEKRQQSYTMKILLAQALIESKHDQKSKDLEEAIKLLNQALDKNPENVFAWRLLSRAYGQSGHMPEAAACLAEESWIMGDTKMAVAKAREGKKSKHQPLAKRSQDILNEAKND